MPVASRYDSVAEAGAHFEELLDATALGIPALFRRRPGRRFALVDAARLRRCHAGLGQRAVVAHEAGPW